MTLSSVISINPEVNDVLAPIDDVLGKEQRNDYSKILRDHGLKYIRNGHYWQLGNIDRTQGWIIHISVIIAQLPDLLERILPEFVQHSVSFKVICNEFIAHLMMDGHLGY